LKRPDAAYYLARLLNLDLVDTVAVLLITDRLARMNDVVFALHASAAGAAVLVQIALYEKGSQTVSLTCKRMTAALAVGLAAAMALSVWPAIPWEPLDFFYLLGYLKVWRSPDCLLPAPRWWLPLLAPACLSEELLHACKVTRTYCAMQVVITVVKYMPQVPSHGKQIQCAGSRLPWQCLAS
jgi:hypothetical protein